MTSYNSNQIKDIISRCCSLVSFRYNDLDYNIDPFPPTHFNVYCDKNMNTVNTIDEVMSKPFFDGKCLNDIADKIQDVEW